MEMAEVSKPLNESRWFAKNRYEWQKLGNTCASRGAESKGECPWCPPVLKLKELMMMTFDYLTTQSWLIGLQ